MVRRQVHLCLTDLDATRLMPALLDVLIPGCPLVWLDDSTGKADETRANLQRIYKLPARPRGPEILEMNEGDESDATSQRTEEEHSKKQRTFIFSADYRPPTSVRTPSRHRASLTQEELAAHAFGPPAKAYDFADRVSAPYYAKPLYEAVSSCSSSASSNAPMLSTSSQSGGSGTSSSSSSPNLPLSPAFTSTTATSATSVSSLADLGYASKCVGTDDESYFPPQPPPQPKCSPPPPCLTSPSSSSIDHQVPQRLNTPIYSIISGPGQATASCVPRRLDRVLERLGKVRVTTANWDEAESALPGPSISLEADALRSSSSSCLASASNEQRSHNSQYDSPSPLVAAQRERPTAMSATAKTQPHLATCVTLETQRDNPISASISGHPAAHATLSSPPSSSGGGSSSAKRPPSRPTMSTVQTARVAELALTTSAKKYRPPPKGTFRSSYARMLRSEMASIGDFGLLRQIAGLSSSESDSSGTGTRAVHPEMTFSLLPAISPDAAAASSSQKVVRRSRRDGQELVRIAEHGVTDHDVVLSVSEFDLFGAKQIISATDRERSTPWERSPAAPPPPKIRRWLRRVRQGGHPGLEDGPSAEIREVLGDEAELVSSVSAYEGVDAQEQEVPRVRVETGRRLASVEPVRMENVTRGGGAQNSDRFVEMQEGTNTDRTFVSPTGGQRSGNSEKEDECIPL